MIDRAGMNERTKRTITDKSLIIRKYRSRDGQSLYITNKRQPKVVPIFP